MTVPTLAFSVCSRAAVALDLDRFADVTDFEPQVEPRGLFHLERDTLRAGNLKAGLRGGDPVGPGREIGQRVCAGRIGHRFALRVRREIRCLDGNSGNGGPGRIGHAAEQCSGGLLGIGHRQGGQESDGQNIFETHEVPPRRRINGFVQQLPDRLGAVYRIDVRGRLPSPLDPDRIMKVPVEDYIRIQGARVHNLKNISLSIPHEKLTVITGVSGSGKSSLAFDTIYAEGQRRYVESLSAYARQFLERMEKPDVDDIDGIAPAIAIRQKNTTRNPRSTVATSTECFDFLRLLYARVGQTFCPNCGTRVRKDTVDEVAARLLMQPEGSRWYALFPCGDHPTTRRLAGSLFELRKKGFNRLFQARPHLRVLHSGISAGYRLHQAGLHAGGPAGDRAGTAPAPGRYHRDLLSRGRRSHLRKRVAGRRSALRFNETIPVQDLRHGVQPAGTDSVQLQLAGGRVPALPGLRQHDRFRHEPRDPRSLALAWTKARSIRGPSRSTDPGWAISKRAAPRSA